VCPPSSPKFFKSLKEGIKNDEGKWYSDIYLWNRDLDRLIRVLQRMESIGILSKQEMKVYEVRLEEVRAALNAHFSGAMATRERDDHSRLKRQRTAWENKNTKPNRKLIRGRRTNYCNVRFESFNCASSTESISTKALNGGMESANQREGPTSSAV